MASVISSGTLHGSWHRSQKEITACADRQFIGEDGTLTGSTRFTDVVIAALITAAATAPIAGTVAYFNHSEALIRLENEKAQQAGVALLARERLGIKRLESLCAGALGYLQDETPNAKLPRAEAQMLLSDMRRTASACVVTATEAAQAPDAGEDRQ